MSLPFTLPLLFIFAGAAFATGPAVVIEKITVDGAEQRPGDDGILHLPPGTHRLDFAIRVVEGESAVPMRVRATLAGFETDWKEVSGQMALEAQFLDAAGVVTGGQRFPCSGMTPGMLATWPRTPLIRRREPLLVPAGSMALRLILTSGAPQTTGRLLLDELTVNSPGGGLRADQDLWRNSGFSSFPDKDQGPEATPDRWQRGGSRPEMARVASGNVGTAIAIEDDDPAGAAQWISEQPLEGKVTPGETLSLSWQTAWQVNPGTRHLVTYHDVGAGDFEFRVAAIALTGGWTGASTGLRVQVARHLWERPWFWPLVAGSVTALLGGAGLLLWHQRMQRRLERLAAQHALERDRARIARDMHDDLGARLTRISLLTALTERELSAGDNPAALVHTEQLSGLARDVVAAIDEIVWAVDPGNDTLDHLGTYLCRFADEFLAGSHVRCRFGIPPILPALPLGAEVRHNLFLAVKEALNNILKHAGPCEARLELHATTGVLYIDITDHGTGFPAAAGLSGNGLRNMERRLKDIGGECAVTSGADGTKVSLRWPIPSSSLPCTPSPL